MEIAGTILLSLITGFTTWFISRKKNNAEAEQSVADSKKKNIENFQLASEVWQDLIADLRKEIQIVSKENRLLKKAVQRLEKALNNIAQCEFKDSCPVQYRLNTEKDNEE
jgi:hypothetical protein